MTLSNQPTPTAATAVVSATSAPVVPSHGALRPLGLDEVTVTGGLWHHYQELNATVIIDHCLTWMERIGWIGNFDRAAAGSIGGNHQGIEFVDSEVYKLLEAMAWEIGRSGSPEIATRYDALVARVGAAQEADGYLHTSFGRPGQPERFSDLEWGHELYCFGHLLQAGVARLRTGHDDALPAICRGVADMLYREFGPEGRVAVCGHPEIEPALVEFSRATGDPRYLELARLLVERRGTGTLAQIDYGPEYFQDDMPVREATELRGHAVRALYLAAGALDVAIESGDNELEAAVKRQWESTMARRTYITGGVGSHHRDEALGADYELPPDRAYSETCAGIASVMLSWRLLLSTGDVRYADLIERTLLNNILASPREDGRAFFYANTLHQRVEGIPPHPTDLSQRADASMRAPWFEVSCCPTNVARTLASVPLYFATADDAGIQIHQYGTYRIDSVGAEGRLSVSVESDYPFGGIITVTVDHSEASAAHLALRIPAWARGSADWECSRAGVELTEHEGYLRISPLEPGDTVTLTLPMEPRFVYPHPHIDAVRGTVAVERGPLVLALESKDLPKGASVNQVEVDVEVAPTTTPRGARVVARIVDRNLSEWPYRDDASSEDSPASRLPVDLLPYFAWANRGPSTMRVFVPIAPSTGGSAATPR